MLTVISCRKSSTNSDEFGAHVIRGNARPFDGGPAGQILLVHGYNQTEMQMTQIYEGFARRLQRDCIAYSWPGGCHPLDFPAAVARASVAGYRLRDVFTMRQLRNCCDMLVTHSLGARVGLTALAMSGIAITKLILMAPAVEWDAFEAGGEFEQVPSQCDSVHILYSNRDEVLKLAFPVGDFGNSCHALGLDGPRDPLQVAANVQLHDCSAAVDSHCAYFSEPDCIALVNEILSQ